MQILDCPQGSDAWFQARLGIPTASEFSTVLAEPRGDGALPQAVMDAMVKNNCTAAQLAAAVKAAKRKNSSHAATRKLYMRKLAGEILTGRPAESYTNIHMERGHEQEDEARKLYAFMTDAELQRVGFIRRGNAGCSPDSLIGDMGGLEIKSALPHIQIERLEKNDLPPEHRAQVQGNIWIAGREWWDFVSYCPGLPLLVVRVHRDDGYIATLAGAVNEFNAELAELVERIRRYGMREAA